MGVSTSSPAPSSHSVSSRTQPQPQPQDSDSTTSTLSHEFVPLRVFHTQPSSSARDEPPHTPELLDHSTEVTRNEDGWARQGRRRRSQRREEAEGEEEDMMGEVRPYAMHKKLGPPVVATRRISKEYRIEHRSDTVRALDSITIDDNADVWSIRQGEFVIVRGPSGGGKTTLLNIIGLIDRPSSGELELFGSRIDNKISDSELADIRLHRIGWVFQTFNLLPSHGAVENVELPMTLLGTLSAAEMRSRAKELLSLVGLQDRLNHLPSELSGGEQQRVTIARALANRAQLILLDEATGDLDSKTKIEIMNLLLKINLEQQMTCVMVTHDPDLECYADRILYVRDGRIVRQVINEKQISLDYDGYMEYLRREQG